MTQHPNATGGLRVLEAFNSSDAQSLQEICSPDIVTHIATLPYRGTYRGIDQLLQVLVKYQELAGNTLRVEPESVLADDGYVMLFFRGQGEREGKNLNSQYVAAAKVGDDGRWRELWLIPDDANAVEEFWRS